MLRNVLRFGAAATDRIQCPTGTSTDTLSPLSIMMWVYPTAFTGGRRLWHKGSAANNTRRHLLINSTSGDLGGFQDMAVGADSTFTTSTVLVLNKWTCVISTFDESDGIRVFLGDLVSPPIEASYAARATTTGAPAGDSAEGFVICNANFGGFARAFEGYLAYCAIVNYWMRLADIRNWYATGQLPPAVKVFYPDVLDNGFVTVLDRSGNLNHGTVTGAVPFATELPWLVNKEFEYPRVMA